MFPGENDYKQYIKANGGHCNASTGETRTTYFFAIQAPFLQGAIERFSGFFHSPLFSPTCTAREINAVDSENSKNQQMDGRRIHQVWKSLVDPAHPWNKFGCGNKNTLSRGAEDWEAGQEDGGPGGRETRRRIVDWYQAQYCATRMKLVIVGKGLSAYCYAIDIH